MYVSTQMDLHQEISYNGDEGRIEIAAPFNAGLYEGDFVRVHNVEHSETRSIRFPGVNQ